MDVARVFGTVYLRLMITHVSGRARSAEKKTVARSILKKEREREGGRRCVRSSALFPSRRTLYITNLNGTNWMLDGG